MEPCDNRFRPGERGGVEGVAFEGCLVKVQVPHGAFFKSQKSRVHSE